MEIHTASFTAGSPVAAGNPSQLPSNNLHKENLVASLMGADKLEPEELGRHLPHLEPLETANIINERRIVLKTIADLLPEKKREKYLLEMAPHLTHCHFDGLDDDLVVKLLENCRSDSVKILKIRSNTITQLPDLPACESLDLGMESR